MRRKILPFLFRSYRAPYRFIVVSRAPDLCPMYKYAINSHETTTKPKASFSFCGFAMIIIIAIRTNKSCKNSIFSPCFDLFWNDNFIQPKLKFNHCVLYGVQRQRDDKKDGGQAHRRYDSENKRRGSKSAATDEAAHGNKRWRGDKSSAAASKAARGYKFYRPHKLHSHLVAQIRF